MPNGKPAGTACVHLKDDMRCAIFADPRRPAVCEAFIAEPAICGESREEALNVISRLELITSTHKD